MMKTLLYLVFLLIGLPLFSQKVESIHFHLYTDSLKKGQHNYINVDGKRSDGTWIPLTSKELDFECKEAAFNGNELILPADFAPEKVMVKATLRSNPALTLEKTIWIKQLPDPDLPGKDEFFNKPDTRRKKKKNR